jgi:uncharacterized membrane protein
MHDFQSEALISLLQLNLPVLGESASHGVEQNTQRWLQALVSSRTAVLGTVTSGKIRFMAVSRS